MSVADDRALLAYVIEVAKKAGALAVSMRPAALAQRIDTKSSPTDLVTVADKAVEDQIVSLLRDRRPDDEIVGEESGETRTAPGSGDVLRWFVDPIDGTTNYVYGAGDYAVSIGAARDGVPLLGVVHNPTTGQLWSALAGHGSWAGDPDSGVRLHGSDKTDLSTALIATGFNYAVDMRAAQGKVIGELLPRIRDIRRHGAAALDLCYAAQGLVDAYFESGGHSWDWAAGALIATEAQLLVTGLRGDPWGHNMLVAARPQLHAALHDALVELGA